VLFVHNFAATPHEVCFSVGLHTEAERLLVNLLGEEHSHSDKQGKHRRVIEAYGYRWYRVGGLVVLAWSCSTENAPRKSLIMQLVADERLLLSIT
jgi:hypothetical protein